jgi:hypothetical protein
LMLSKTVRRQQAPARDAAGRARSIARRKRHPTFSCLS